MIGGSKFEKLTLNQQQIVIEAIDNIDMKRIWSGVVLSIFVFSFSAIPLEAYLWNFIIWKFPYRRLFYQLTTTHWIQLIIGYIIGYIIAMFIAQKIGDKEK